MALDTKNRDLKLPWHQQLFASVLRVGAIPDHVAFIMDGNRRFAKKSAIEKIDGHSMGFDKLGEVLQWCQVLGVSQVTVYAFSAENFKRSEQEVNDLMELARRKFSKILEQKDKLQEHGVRICFVGELHRLPKDLQDIVYDLNTTTAGNTKCRLNVCVAYTSRIEMKNAVKSIYKGVQEGSIQPSEIDEQLFEQTLDIPKVDLLVRTSGEVRLSDFLLWQSSYSCLSFVKCLWPEFSIWSFFWSILEYQWSYLEMAKSNETEHQHANGNHLHFN